MAIIQVLREKIPIFSNAPKREFARLILQNLTLTKQHFTVIPYDDEYIFITKAEKYLIEEVPGVLLAHTLTIYRKMENLTYSKPNLSKFS